MIGLRNRPHILLLKGAVEAESEESNDVDRYRQVLPAIPCSIIPVLKFEIGKSEIQRLEASTFSSILATSSRAAWALGSAASPVLLQRIRDVPWFVVGEASRDVVCTRLGVQVCYGAETGSAERLLEQIGLGSYKPLPKVAYLCSNLRRQTISDGLQTLRIPFEEFVIYNTVPNVEAELPTVADDMTRVCVFFSPSGVTAVSRQLRDNDVIIAIGQTTAGALKQADVQVAAVATSPSPQGLLSALCGCGVDIPS